MTPFLTREITDENEYFGRDYIIKHLTSFANMGLNKEIIGLRRSGKTSLLKIMEGKLRQDKSTAYPVFFDFKEAGVSINGTESVYKYMIARLMARLYEDDLLNGNYAIRGQTIMPSSCWEDIYDCLSEISLPKTIGMFSELIESCAKEIKKSILFLIDEYECLFKDRFDKPEGFMPMRSLSQKTTSDGNKLFSFWIAGAVDWVEMCTSTGSPQLNVIDSPTIFLGSIDRESFHTMWEHEINFCQDEDIKRFLSEKEEMAFALSGGFPHFGKQIGGHLLSYGKDPDNTTFDKHFKDILKVLNESEKQCLKMLAKNHQDCSSRTVLDKLENTGLVKKLGQKYEINIPYLAIFLNSMDTASGKDNWPESYIIANEAEEYYSLINQNCSNYGKTHFFQSFEVTLEIWKDIRTPCTSRDGFYNFIYALNKLMKETTRDGFDSKGKPIYRFPKSFMQPGTPTRRFWDIIGILRNTDAHIKSIMVIPNWKIQYEDALQILLGSKNEPQSEEDFKKLQIEVLKLFRDAMKMLQGNLFPS